MEVMGNKNFEQLVKQAGILVAKDYVRERKDHTEEAAIANFIKEHQVPSRGSESQDEAEEAGCCQDAAASYLQDGHKDEDTDEEDDRRSKVSLLGPALASPSQGHMSQSSSTSGPSNRWLS